MNESIKALTPVAVILVVHHRGSRRDKNRFFQRLEQKSTHRADEGRASESSRYTSTSEFREVESKLRRGLR